MPHDFSTTLKDLIDQQLATGKYSDEEDVLLHALHALQDYNESVADIQEGMNDEAAGRLRPLDEVDSDIRQKLGFNK